MSDDITTVNFPTLWVAVDWCESHCVIPDGPSMGEPLVYYPWQLWATVNMYRIGGDARPMSRSAAFRYRRGQIMTGQK